MNKWRFGKELRKQPSGLEKDLQFAVARALKPYRKTKQPLQYETNMPLFGFIPDVHIEKLRLILEADGPHHDKQRDYDEFRDSIFRKNGYTVERFHYSEFKDLDALDERVQTIVDCLYRKTFLKSC